MAKPSQHLHAGADTDDGPEGGTTTGPSRWQKVVGVIGLLVVLWVGRDLYGVVTSDGERPSGGTPPAGDPAPPAGGAHDPSQFRH